MIFWFLFMSLLFLCIKKEISHFSVKRYNILEILVDFYMNIPLYATFPDPAPSFVKRIRNRLRFLLFKDLKKKLGRMGLRP